MTKLPYEQDYDTDTSSLRNFNGSSQQKPVQQAQPTPVRASIYTEDMRGWTSDGRYVGDSYGPKSGTAPA